MIVSLTIIRYRKALVPFAVLAMAVHKIPMMVQKGCTFWKLLGCGKDGTFSMQSDWQQWGLLAVWESRDDFDKFNKSSLIAGWWKVFAYEKWTVLLIPQQSRGKWNGREPFGNPEINNYNGPIAVLTRATIRMSKLKSFWTNVESVASIMATAPGYITSVSIGEAPIYRQGTFSVWQSIDDIKSFAYASKEHTGVIKKTRDENWYSEELFARFRPVASFGMINGKYPLAGFDLNKDYENNSRVTSS